MPVYAIGREEFIADISLTAINTPYLLPGSGLLPMDRFMSGIYLMFEGRITNAGSGNPSAVLADAPYSLIERVTISGYHRPRKQNEVFFDLRGAEIRELARDYSASNPLSTPATLVTTANGTNDIRFMLPIIFPPEAISAVEQINYILDAPNYDQLKLQVNFADDASVFTRTTAGAFSAYNSATGSPRIRVTGMFSLAGASRFQGFVPARVYRYMGQELTSGDILNTVTGSRLFNLPRGYRMRSILVKCGVKSTGTTAGNNAYSTLSNTIFTNLKIFRGLGKQLKHYIDQNMLQDFTRQAFGLAPSTGYGVIDWCQHGKLGEVLDMTGTIAGPTGDVDSYVAADIAGAANQGALAVWQEVRYSPQNVLARTPSQRQQVLNNMRGSM